MKPCVLIKDAQLDQPSSVASRSMIAMHSAALPQADAGARGVNVPCLHAYCPATQHNTIDQFVCAGSSRKLPTGSTGNC